MSVVSGAKDAGSTVTKAAAKNKSSSKKSTHKHQPKSHHTASVRMFKMKMARSSGSSTSKPMMVKMPGGMMMVMHPTLAKGQPSMLDKQIVTNTVPQMPHGPVPKFKKGQPHLLMGGTPNPPDFFQFVDKRNPPKTLQGTNMRGTVNVPMATMMQMQAAGMIHPLQHIVPGLGMMTSDTIPGLPGRLTEANQQKLKDIIVNKFGGYIPGTKTIAPVTASNIRNDITNHPNFYDQQIPQLTGSLASDFLGVGAGTQTGGGQTTANKSPSSIPNHSNVLPMTPTLSQDTGGGIAGPPGVQHSDTIGVPKSIPGLNAPSLGMTQSGTIVLPMNPNPDEFPTGQITNLTPSQGGSITYGTSGNHPIDSAVPLKIGDTITANIPTKGGFDPNTQLPYSWKYRTRNGNIIMSQSQLKIGDKITFQGSGIPPSQAGEVGNLLAESMMPDTTATPSPPPSTLTPSERQQITSQGGKGPTALSPFDISPNAPVSSTPSSPKPGGSNTPSVSIPIPDATQAVNFGIYTPTPNNSGTQSRQPVHTAPSQQLPAMGMNLTPSQLTNVSSRIPENAQAPTTGGFQDPLSPQQVFAGRPLGSKDKVPRQSPGTGLTEAQLNARRQPRTEEQIIASVHNMELARKKAATLPKTEAQILASQQNAAKLSQLPKTDAQKAAALQNLQKARNTPKTDAQIQANLDQLAKARQQPQTEAQRLARQQNMLKAQQQRMNKLMAVQPPPITDPFSSEKMPTNEQLRQFYLQSNTYQYSEEPLPSSRDNNPMSNSLMQLRAKRLGLPFTPIDNTSQTQTENQTRNIPILSIPISKRKPDLVPSPRTGQLITRTSAQQEQAHLNQAAKQKLLNAPPPVTTDHLLSSIPLHTGSTRKTQFPISHTTGIIGGTKMGGSLLSSPITDPSIPSFQQLADMQSATNNINKIASQPVTSNEQTKLNNMAKTNAINMLSNPKLVASISISDLERLRRIANQNLTGTTTVPLNTRQVNQDQFNVVNKQGESNVQGGQMGGSKKQAGLLDNIAMGLGAAWGDVMNFFGGGAKNIGEGRTFIGGESVPLEEAFIPR
jgi:hypothetical protein